MGVTSEMATDQPGYTGYRPASAATLAQVLSGNGWSTAAFGKWHQTPPVEVNTSGPFTRWPTGEGFDRFYGFMGAEMNHWYPQLYDGTTPVEPDRLPEDGYHLTEDLVDHAVDWVTAQHELTPDKPFLCYLALGATHAPFHVAPEWIERYAGAFDDGWDVQRERTLARQKELGLVPPEAELAPWADGVPHWDELDPPARRVAARFMETYAGFAEHADHHVGRLVDRLQHLGVLDDTLVLYLLGDNGASGEGGPEGTIREHLVGHGFADDVQAMAAVVDRIGDASTYGMYPAGWALAMNTPYQWTKQVASHLGGTRDGLVVHWPAGIEAHGEVRHQFHHVIDVLPTVLDVAGLPAPVSVARGRAAAGRGHLDAVLLRRRRRARPPHDAVLRDGRQPGDLPRGLDGGDPARRPVADGRRAATVRGRRVGALRPRHRLDAGPRRGGGAPGAAGRAARAVRPGGRAAPGPPARRPGHRAREPRTGRPARPARGPHVAELRAARGAADRGGGAERQEPHAHRLRAGRRGRRRRRRARRAGRSLRRLVALLPRGPAVLRLQLLRPGAHHPARCHAAGAGGARAGPALRVRRGAARRRGGGDAARRRSRGRGGGTSRRPRPTTSASTRRSTSASTGAPR